MLNTVQDLFRRAIQSKIEDRLANELLEGKIKRGDIVQVQYEK